MLSLSCFLPCYIKDSEIPFSSTSIFYKTSNSTYQNVSQTHNEIPSHTIRMAIILQINFFKNITSVGKDMEKSVPWWIHWCECKMRQQLWISIWQFLKKIEKTITIWFRNYSFVLFVCFFRAAPTAYGGFQARGRIWAVAASLCLPQPQQHQIYKLRLWPTPQLMATQDP